MLRRVVFSLLLSLFVLGARAQALPAGVAYTSTATRTGGLVGDSIVMNLGRRGFAANDPRVLSTVEAIGERTTLTAVGGTAEAAGAVRLLPILARLNPYFAGALVLTSAVSILLNSDGTVSIVTHASGLTYGAFAAGSTIYCLNGNSGGTCAPSAVTAFVELIRQDPRYTTISSITDTDNGVPGRHYFHAAVLKNGAADGYDAWFGPATSPVSCVAGQVLNSGACVAAKSTPADYTPPSGGNTSSPMTPAQAAAALPSDALTASIPNDSIAKIANAAWQAAAANPAYAGMPFDPTQPVTAVDPVAAEAVRPATSSAANPATVVPPKNADLGGEVLPDDPKPWIETGIKPTNSTSTVPPADSASAPTVKVDLGTDPGVVAPTLEDTPTDLFAPVVSLMSPWTTFQVPDHAGQCPTWSASPTIAGTTFQIDLSSHCQLFEQYRSVIAAAVLLCWLAVGAFILLSA